VSALLKQYLVEWLEWAEADAPNHDLFTRRVGLCSNLVFWSASLDGEIRYALEKELDRMFAVDGLDVCHPFGFDEYVGARRLENQHLDPKRLSWVRSKVAQHEAV